VFARGRRRGVVDEQTDGVQSQGRGTRAGGADQGAEVVKEYRERRGVDVGRIFNPSSSRQPRRIENPSYIDPAPRTRYRADIRARIAFAWIVCAACALPSASDSSSRRASLVPISSTTCMARSCATISQG